MVIDGTAVDKVHVSDACYREVCMGSDTIAGEMWKATKEIQSAGYTEAGFISGLLAEAMTLGVQLVLVYTHFEIGKGIWDTKLSEAPAMFFGIMETVPTAPTYRVLCRSSRPLAPKIAMAAERFIDTLTYGPQNVWINRKFLVVRETPGAIPAEKSLTAAHAILASMGKDYDPFSRIIQAQGNAAYEALRRQVL